MDPGTDRAERKTVIEMDICDHGDRGVRKDFGQSANRGFIGDRTADDLASGIREFPDLRGSCFGIRGIRIRHGLDRDRARL